MKQCQILLYPGLQLISFVLGLTLYSRSVTIGLLLVLAAAYFQCYALHIFAHELAHHPGWCASRLARRCGELLVSVLLGMPFNGYRINHRNHHYYSNALGDFTSTWRETRAGPKPRGKWCYALGWPAKLFSGRHAMLQELPKGYFTESDVNKMTWDSVVIGIVVVLLFSVSATFGFLYLTTVYLGWTLVALVNYAQHPPRDYGELLATSYRGSTFNRICFNNGLHYEHHRYPGRRIADLKPMAAAPMIGRNHLSYALKG